ncbi:MAG: glutamate-5-semialdehyde dehydrogenase [Corynebacterium sp.]|nr:glutamate-5-semialdehyde dehydrogenase [Corynebacterium sp.]
MNERATQERQRVLEMAQAAKAITPVLAILPSASKDAILRAAAETLQNRSAEILEANAQDIAVGEQRGLSDSLLDRLRLDTSRIAGIAAGLEQVAALPDPVGQIVRGHVLPNGIQLTQLRVPLGVMAMVYEARPNVTVDAFGLALKSGNAALLRGSKSAKYSNQALVKILQDVLADYDLPRESVQLLPCETHESVQDVITARGLVDVVIPRGGAGLIEAVVTNATVPTIETGTGNCHFYIHADADIAEAIALVLNGKTRRPSVCNATETVLLDAGLSQESKQEVLSALLQAGVKVHGKQADFVDFDAATKEAIIPAEEADWSEEYLSMDIAVGIVDGLQGAITHIRRYSSGHTDAISTSSLTVSQKFVAAIDSAAVMVNTSTAFTDGEQFGMGAEIGISTQKLHARGPMGLPELTSTKWVAYGQGQTRP